jgi:hypothetical protein
LLRLDFKGPLQTQVWTHAVRLVLLVLLAAQFVAGRLNGHGGVSAPGMAAGRGCA